MFLSQTLGIREKIGQRSTLAVKQWDFKEHTLLKCHFEYSHKFLRSRSYIYLKEDELLVGKQWSGYLNQIFGHVHSHSKLFFVIIFLKLFI